MHLFIYKLQARESSELQKLGAAKARSYKSSELQKLGATKARSCKSGELQKLEAPKAMELHKLGAWAALARSCKTMEQQKRWSWISSELHKLEAECRYSIIFWIWKICFWLPYMGYEYAFKCMLTIEYLYTERGSHILRHPTSIFCAASSVQPPASLVCGVGSSVTAHIGNVSPPKKSQYYLISNNIYRFQFGLRCCIIVYNLSKQISFFQQYCSVSICIAMLYNCI